jgi:hypothetical protein
MSDAWSIAGNVGSALGGISNSILGWVNYDTQRKNAEKNYKLAKATFDWNKQQTEWEKAQYLNSLQREDTAVQRRVEDLKAAGINPLLAAGQAAATSGPISPNHVETPQKTLPDMPQDQALQMWLMVKDQLLTQAELKKMDEERKNLIEDTNLKRENANWESFKNSEMEQRWKAEYGLDLQKMEEWVHDKEYLLKEGSPTWQNRKFQMDQGSQFIRDMGVDPDTTLGKLLRILLILGEQFGGR